MSCISFNINLTLIFLLAASNQILQTYKTDPKMEAMMKNMDFYITPVLNMDGYIYSWNDNSVSGHFYLITCLGFCTLAPSSPPTDEQEMRECLIRHWQLS